MADVNNYIKQIQTLQKNVNDAVVKRNTQISKKQSLQQQLHQLQEKCQKQFQCSVQQLKVKRDEYEKQLAENINELKKILGIS